MAESAVHEWPSGKKVIFYHTNWACYGRNFQVKDLPIQHITDINYAFLDLRPNDSGLLVPTISDAWADIDKRYTNVGEGVEPADTWNEDASYFGNFGQFMKLKNDWEHISPPGKNYGEAGNEVRDEDPANFASFLELLRTRLDADGKSSFEISACVVGDPNKMEALPLEAMSKYLTTINIMTYDFASSAWGPCLAGHHTNLKATPYAPLSVERAVDALLSKGVPASKIVIGAAFYSRAFANTDGLGQPSSGTSPDKSWEDGVCDYKVLPISGAVEFWDDAAKASYAYDPSKRVLTSYDTPQSIREKCKFVWEKGLKGIIVWESSGDVPNINNERSLTRALYDGLSKDPR
ncbi:hypothetical protein HDV05_003653 [Chytridiales sp. JEL 0842]|nr:hypothetical protein HDV05_003653 [Chytridiales sp. JEL 0842]